MSLASLPDNFQAVVFGATGGIGGAICSALARDPRCSHILAGSRAGVSPQEGKTAPFAFNLEDESSIVSAGSLIDRDRLHLVVVATGVLHGPGVHPEKTLRSVSASSLQTAFAVNAIGPGLICKHFLPLFSRRGKSVLVVLSARVGSISDNRLGGWHSYRASKAALNMLVRTFAIEQTRTHPDAVCIAVHPGTVETHLSRPFLKRSGYNTAVSPEVAASRILSVVDGAQSKQSGLLLDWDGTPIAF